MNARTLVALAAVGVVAQVSMAQSFHILGDSWFPTDATNDGLVVGSDLAPDGPVYTWTAGGGQVNIGGGMRGGQVKVSDDGAYISGTLLNDASGFYEMGRYSTASSTWTALGSLGASSDGSASSGWGMSGDGSTVVGLGWINAGNAHAINWTSGSGVVDMGSSVMDRSTRANSANHDGSVIVGWQDAEDGFRQAAVWRNGVQTVITDQNGFSVSEASDVDSAGTWVVGGNGPTEQAWRWSEATGLEELGILAGGFFVRGAATAISGDGSTIIGYERGFGPPTAGIGFIWRDGVGMVNLTEYVQGLGIDTQGLVLSLPLGISEDGKTIVGAGRPEDGFGIVPWVVTIPTPSALAVLGLGGLVATRRRR